MSCKGALLAVAAVLVGGMFLARRSEAGESELFEEIRIAAKRLGEGIAVDGLFSRQDLPLGLRQNNPMNLRYNQRNDWVGKRPYNGSGYESFDTHGNGIRAGSKTLVNYWRFHRIDNVRAIVRRYAPREDNNPEQAYAHFLADRLGVGLSQSIDMTDPGMIADLAEHIIAFEQGQQPFSKAFIREHVNRAFA